MFINTKVFDPSLEGQAVRLSGLLIEGNFIVCKVHNYQLDVIGEALEVQELPIGDFEHGAIEMVVLEIPEPKIKPLFNQVVVMETLPEIEIIEPIKPHKTGFTRNQGSRNIRSDLQIKVDNAHVEYILKSNGEPLKLEKIVNLMQINHGHYHWNKNNGSGFIQHAIKLGKKIKKVEYGVYGYDWEAGE